MKPKDQSPRGNWEEEAADNSWDIKQNWIEEVEPEERPHAGWIEEEVD